jgi:hypothetical protein
MCALLFANDPKADILAAALAIVGVLGLASPSAELCWRQDLAAEACLFLDSTCQRMIRNDTRRQRQSQLSKSRSDAAQRVGEPAYT